jgi:hypothetical protein
MSAGAPARGLHERPPDHRRRAVHPAAQTGQTDRGPSWRTPWCEPGRNTLSFTRWPLSLHISCQGPALKVHHHPGRLPRSTAVAHQDKSVQTDRIPVGAASGDPGGLPQRPHLPLSACWRARPGLHWPRCQRPAGVSRSLALGRRAGAPASRGLPGRAATSTSRGTRRAAYRRASATRIDTAGVHLAPDPPDSWHRVPAVNTARPPADRPGVWTWDAWLKRVIPKVERRCRLHLQGDGQVRLPGRRPDGSPSLSSPRGKTCSTNRPEVQEGPT